VKITLHVDIEYDLPDQDAADLETDFVDMIQKTAQDPKAVYIDAKIDDRVVLDLDRRGATP